MQMCFEFFFFLSCWT